MILIAIGSNLKSSLYGMPENNCLEVIKILRKYFFVLFSLLSIYSSCLWDVDCDVGLFFGGGSPHWGAKLRVRGDHSRASVSVRNWPQGLAPEKWVTAMSASGRAAPSCRRDERRVGELETRVDGAGGQENLYVVCVLRCACFACCLLLFFV